MRKKQVIYHGYNSVFNIKDILQKEKVKKIFIVCGESYKRFPVKEFIEKLGIPIIYFSSFSANPAFESVLLGIDILRKEDCDFIISIGGGSAIDVAKGINAYISQEETIDIQQAIQSVRFKHLAIPTTAGTGSESTHFAVIYNQGEKISIEHPDLIPDYVILDPQFLAYLPEYHKKATMLDALCQSIESLWSINSTEESKSYAKKSLEMTLKNITPYFEGDKESMSEMLLAANYSGRAINISKTTAAHAMSYKLSSMYGIAHGHAVALCLSYVWEYMLKHKNQIIDGYDTARFEGSLKLINSCFGETKSDMDSLQDFRHILKKMKFEPLKLKTPLHIKVLSESVNQQRLANNPIFLTDEGIREIYRQIFTMTH